MGDVSSVIDPPVGARAATVVPSGMTIRGDVEGMSDLHVHGLIVGRVLVTSLVVGSGALIDGPVLAETVIVGGRVTGSVKARTVHLLATALVDGDVICDSMRMDVGACFNGRCSVDEAADGRVIPALRAVDGGLGLSDAGTELLRLAARLRQVTL